MKTKLFALLAALLALTLLAACAPMPAPAPSATQPPAVSPPPAAPTTTPTEAPTPVMLQKPAFNVISLKGPTGMGMVQLMDASDKGEAAIDYTFTLASAPDEVSGKLVTGEVDIAAVPINLAAALYNKTNGNIAVIAINTKGVLYVLENGTSIQSIADLADKTLFATGQGATPAYILQFLLEKNGIADKVKIEYQNDHAELAALLAAGQGDVKIAMLPEPNVTAALIKNPELRVALNLTEEWDKVAGGPTLVQGCIVVRRDILATQPDAVNLFLQEYALSTAFANDQPAEAAALIETYGIMPAAAAAQRALPNCNIVCITGADMKANAQAMLDVLFQANPASIGGAMPEDDFYYIP